MRSNILKAVAAAALLTALPGSASAQFSAYNAKGEVVVDIENTVPDSVTFYYPSESQEADISLVGGSIPKPKDAIDLGLSVKWAPWNVGADKPSDYGEYFAWGEIVPHKDAEGTYGSYYWDTYHWGNAAAKQTIMFKYNDGDSKKKLDEEDDAATVNWGGKWRMPTQAELAELLYSCKWTWTDNYKESGHAGYEITRDGYGGVLFLPAAGYRWYSYLGSEGSDGYYWSSELGPGDSLNARVLYFNSGYRSADNYGNRYYGFSVRAVWSPAGI